METGDASNEEAPPWDPKRKDLMQKERLKVISMLVAMETEDSLRRGVIMVITKKLAWHMQRKNMHELGIINSSEFSTLKNSGRGVMYSPVSFLARCSVRLPHEVFWTLCFIFPRSNHTE